MDIVETFLIGVFIGAMIMAIFALFSPTEFEMNVPKAIKACSNEGGYIESITRGYYMCNINGRSTYFPIEEAEERK